MIRVGIIGCGRISDFHARGYQGRADAAIVALCDTNRANAETRALRWGVPGAAIFEDYRDLCGSGLVDLVEILVPHHLHYEIAAHAIESDLHVSVQKPMALSLGQADELVSAAASSSKVVRLYENFLFYPPVQTALGLLEDGLIGEALSVRLKSNAGYSPDAWDIPFDALLWRNNPDECGGGPLVFDDGHHKFSLAWIVLGQPSQAHAWIGTTDILGFKLDSPSLVSMRYGSGAVANLEVVYSPELLIEGTDHYAQDDRMEITGTRGVVWVNRGHGQIGNPAPVVSYADGDVQAYECETGWEHSFIGATRNLLDVITSGGDPILGLAEGRDMLAASLAAQRSAQTGSTADVDAPIGRPPGAVRAALLESAAQGPPASRAESSGRRP